MVSAPAGGSTPCEYDGLPVKLRFNQTNHVVLYQKGPSAQLRKDRLLNFGCVGIRAVDDDEGTLNTRTGLSKATQALAVATTLVSCWRASLPR